MSIKPYFESKHCTLYHGDCLEIMPQIEAGSIGLVATDPPYGNNYSTGYRKGIVRATTKITGDIITKPLLNDTAELLKPLLDDTAAIYWFAAPDQLDMVLPILKQWKVVNVLCWDKGNCSAGDLVASYGKQWEACVYAVTKKSPLIGGRDRDILRFSRGNSSQYVHPTQKPIELITYLLQRHYAKNVLDPFMGSGTTGVACVNTGRKFIGIEQDEKYFCVAVERIKAAEAEAAQRLL